MLFKVSTAITCDGSGDATVYLGSKLTGRIHAIFYDAGTLDAGTDIVVTGETTGVPILTDSPAADEWFYPRVIPNKNTDGSAFTDAATDIWVYQERIKVVVAQGGASGAGDITVYIDEVSPY